MDANELVAKYYDKDVELAKMLVERDANKAEPRRFQQTIVELEAENARLHRSLEERMSVHIPGAVQVAKTEELHGMAKGYLVPPGSEDL